MQLKTASHNEITSVKDIYLAADVGDPTLLTETKMKMEI